MKNVKIFKNTTKKGVVFFIGLISIALGSIHMIQVSSLGVQPFDVYYIGLSEKLPITIGMASIGTGILLVTTALIISKEKLKIGTILDTIFLGLFVDLLLHADFIHKPFTLFGQISFFILGTIFIAFGCALTILSSLGAGPIDTLMLAIHKKSHLSVKAATTVIEVAALVIGFLLGGPVGICTFIFSIIIGPFIEWFLTILLRVKQVKVKLALSELGKIMKLG